MEKKSLELLAQHVEEELMDYILQEPVNVGDKIPNEFENRQMILKLKQEHPCE